jgi:hypothetical protein
MTPPFIHEAPDPPKPAWCSVCGDQTRTWKFSEEPVRLATGHTAVVGFGLCQECIATVLGLIEEDDDRAGPASDPPA